MSVNHYMITHSPHDVKTNFQKQDNNSVFANPQNTRNVVSFERSDGIFSYNNSFWTFINNSKCMRNNNFVLGHLRYKKRKRKIPIFLHSPDNDIHISRVLLNGGSWEENNMLKAVEVMGQYPDATFIDIGAHVGVFSLTLASLGYKVIAIDCFKDNIERLCASAKLGNLSKNMYIIHNALSDKKATVVVRESSPSNIGGNNIVQKSSLNMNTGKTVMGALETIQAIRLDDLLEVVDIKSAVLKLDVEGSEHNVLKGAENFFRSVNVHFVMMEFHTHKDRDSGKFILDFMNEHGFQPILPTGVSLTNQNEWPWDVHWTKRKKK
ncbi:Hypothetical predicted protein [Mytilus galloprovincialis]|uniref:Methyltransferase FkbM domain-containing protein n=1 Tax=Mytilus galloprovincialis TaxID=29158 RepID=A0A8B6FM09_MYTGA|nr:Hypothetical predicted protein [Mytilus galloprovincialis]